MPDTWVNFKKIIETVSMEMVLKHYGVLDRLKKSGRNLVSCYPIHQGSNPRQFSVNLEDNMFNCFGDCKSGGNVLDSVAKMEKVSTREAVLLFKEWFSIEGKRPEQGQKAVVRTEKLVRKEKQARPGAVNPPLKFELKSLTPEHRFFQERGILPATVKHFGLGFCSRGLTKDRIAIPIHNEKGQLVAHCGRAMTEEQIEQEGKYKMPAGFV